MTRKTWWTFQEVVAYLGHTNEKSSEVWMTRHGIQSVIHYPAEDIIRERERTKRRTR